MIRVLYVVPQDDFAAHYMVGISKKILQQIAAFERLGCDVSLFYFENNCIKIKRQGKICATYKISKLRWKLGDITAVLNMHFGNKKDIYDLIYLRKNMITPFSLHSIKTMRKYAKQIICEIPTYPYEAEAMGNVAKRSFFTKIRPFCVFMCDVFLRRFLKKYIACFTVIGEMPSGGMVFGVPAIHIENGTESFPLRSKTFGKTVEFIGVAAVHYWHGYDRLIHGLHRYYMSGGEEIIIFHIVGLGPEIESLKQLAINLKLGERVMFHGIKTGSELDELFNRVDIGIGSLGLHRSGISASATLKAREYCARQIPFIVAGYDSAFKENLIWRLQVSSNDEPIKIQDVLNFSNQFRADAAICPIADYRDEMRDYALKNLSWDVQIRKILELSSTPSSVEVKGNR